MGISNMYDFGLDLQRLINIKSNKKTNILAEGTYGLYDKKEEEVIFIAYDYKQVLEKVRPRIKNEEVDNTWMRGNKEKREHWKLHTFFDDYDLVFHEFTPISYQQKHRIDFINELYHGYFTCKFEDILGEANYGTSNKYMFDSFVKDKKLKNRINIRKFPFVCCISTKDDIREIDNLIPFLFDQFDEKEFKLDVKAERHVGTKVFLSTANKDIITYLKLTVSENWKVETVIDFSGMIQYMDEIENIIETRFLK